MAIAVGVIRLDDVEFHAFNHGRDLGDLRGLTDSIRRNGLIHPIVVERRGPRFRIRAGHRRVAAARLAGLAKIPALIHSEPLPDREWLVHMVEENTLRKDLSGAERRDIVRRLRALDVKWEGIAAAFGVAPATARSWLALPGEGDAAASLPAPAAATHDLPSKESPRAAPSRVAPKRRPPAVVSIRKVADTLDGLRTRAAAGVVTVEECIAAVQLVLDLTRGTAAVAADESETVH